VRFGRLDEAIDGYRSALDAVRVRSTGADVALAMETARQRADALDQLLDASPKSLDESPRSNGLDPARPTDA
jgi:hypothetical protein